jgi:replicative DNA helicase
MFQKYIHFNPDIEEAVIGICLLEKEAFGRTFGLLQPDNFYSEANKIIYGALKEMYHYSVPIDLFTVGDYLFNRKNIKVEDPYVTPYYLMKTTNAVCSSVHLEYHCHVIKRLWMEREIINITHGSLKLEGEVSEKIIRLNKAIQDINQNTQVKEWVDMSEVMYNIIMHQEEMERTGGKGLTTGLKTLDENNGGFFPGQMIVIGARPSVGKSAFMGQMALAMAKKGKVVGIISLEMNNTEVGARLSSIETEINYKTIYRNLYQDESQKKKWYERMQDYINYPIYISDATRVNAIDIKAKAQKLKHQHGLDCLMIDYMQLVAGDNSQRGRTRENEVSDISRNMKLMAKELNVPLVVLCQLNRMVSHRTGASRYPILSDLRESGGIEQDADAVMFLHRDYLLGEQYITDEHGNSTIDKADLIVRKWRSEESNIHIPLYFDGPKMQFREVNQIEHWKPVEVDYSGDNPFQ